MEPLSDIISLLRPRAAGAKVIEGAGRWAARYERVDNAGFGLVLAGECRLHIDGHAPVRLAQGDFILTPTTTGFTLAGDPDVEPVLFDAAEAMALGASRARHGDPEGEAEFRMLGGYFQFDPANLALLTGLLPAFVHIRAADAAAGRLGRMIALIADEALSDRPGRDLVVERWVEILLVEGLRHRPEGGAAERAGLLRGLADPHLARALRRLHAEVSAGWTVASLAREAGLSRSAFSERFARTVGASPMDYLIQWRMALAKDLLQREAPPLETVAAAVGYQSASAFSTAFRRRVGRSPGRFAAGAGAG